MHLPPPLQHPAGILLLLAGFVLLPLPIPLGLVCVAGGLMLLRAGRRRTGSGGRGRRPVPR